MRVDAQSLLAARPSCFTAGVLVRTVALAVRPPQHDAHLPDCQESLDARATKWDQMDPDEEGK